MPTSCEEDAEIREKWNRVVVTTELLMPYAAGGDGTTAWLEKRSAAWATACWVEALKTEGRDMEAAVVLLVALPTSGRPQ
jgi:hypothetical protein